MSNSNDSTDAFLQIAQRTQEKLEGLVEPQPVPMLSDEAFELKAGSGEVCVPAIPRDDTWFDQELVRLRELWAPFIANHAPQFESVRQRQELTEFDWRVDSEITPNRLPDALSGAGEWEAVTVPHFDGPMGRQTSFYRATVDLAAPSEGERIWLHFEGVDYIAKVYLNGNFVGQHEGIFAPFEFDVSDYVISGGENVLLVQVDNDAIMMANVMWDSKEAGDKLYAATGPGWDESHIGWHHCPPGMGIYRKVYFETRPELFIEDGWVRPLLKESAVELWLEVHSSSALEEAVSIEVQIHGRNFEAELLGPETYKLSGQPGVGRNYYRVRLALETDRLWTPETPWLHALQVKLGQDAQECVFGMRDFRMDTESEIKGRLYLNDQPIKLRGVNTMGHEQLCVMAGDDAQLLDDILIYKMAGLNYIRFTQRPVEREVYDLCDALGLMAQVDLPLFKNLRRNQFNEAVRQTSEMERFARRHASVVVASFINEPFPLHWHNELHRHLGKDELSAFFDSASTAIFQENPDRVIKPVDGDYDPPSEGLPDNHCYTLWYNGHGIDFGKLEAGYWQQVKPGWYFGCGEYGAEGLDPVDLMRLRYPADWLPQSAEEEKEWTPRQVRKAQTGDMYQVFFDKPDTLEGWVEASQDFQAWSVMTMTEAFRRDPRMVSFALHLGIDAFPSGWMKTIVDCERRPKKGFFALRDALAPVLPTLRVSRRFWWSDESFEAELWISSDLFEAVSALELRAELWSDAGLLGSLKKELPELDASSAQGFGMLKFPLPQTDSRQALKVCLQVVDREGSLMGQSEFSFDVFARLAELPEWNVATELSESMIERVKSGETIVCGPLKEGKYTFDEVSIEIAPVGMGQLIFASRATGHPLVEDFEVNDFRLWFDDAVGYASTFADNLIIGEGWTPILMAGRGGFGEKWIPTPVVAEKQIGDGRLIICQLKMEDRIAKNPPAALFAKNLNAL